MSTYKRNMTVNENFKNEHEETDKNLRKLRRKLVFTSALNVDGTHSSIRLI